MVSDLTGMDVANASLLDEATAAAEAMSLLLRVHRGAEATTFLVSDRVFPQVREVILTRATPLGPHGALRGSRSRRRSDRTCSASTRNRPMTAARCVDLSALIERAHAAGARVAVGTDLLAMALVTPPGDAGADVVVGSAQRFGVPLGYGGPHAGFFATREEFVRQMPGRLIGVSVDARGRRAYRMALQTREQHIRREKATSNICTAQALLANMAAFYARVSRSGRDSRHRARACTTRRCGSRPPCPRWAGSRRTARTSTRCTSSAAPPTRARYAAPRRLAASTSAIRRTGVVQLSLDETVSEADLADIVAAFEDGTGASAPRLIPPATRTSLPDALRRRSAFLGASGVQRASLRDGDDAVHPVARAQRPRARHRDDSARLVHDEAQRGGRDAAGELAGVLAHPPVRAGGADGRATSRSSRSSRTRSARSPGFRRCRCSPTRARRASSRDCS